MEGSRGNLGNSVDVIGLERFCEYFLVEIGSITVRPICVWKFLLE